MEYILMFIGAVGAYMLIKYFTVLFLLLMEWAKSLPKADRQLATVIGIVFAVMYVLEHFGFKL